MSANLTEKAMLAKLSITKWSARKHDKTVSAEVARNHGTAQDRGRYNKVLVAVDALKAIQQAESAARTYHYENTLPWKDDGARILPAANYLEYSSKMRQLKTDFQKAVMSFMGNYSDLVDQARRDLGTLFKEDDYPTPAVVARKFAFDIEIDPLPAASDFRVTLQGDEVDRIKAEIEGRMQAAQQTAMDDLYNRLYDVVKHMADKLNDQKAIFRDTLVSNVSDLVDLLPRLNLTGDARLEDLRREVQDKLLGYEPDILRKNQFARMETAQNANDILASMAGYGNVA